MPISMERIVQLEDVKKDDIIIFKYAGKTERYIVLRIDHLVVKVSSERGESSLKIFSVKNLILNNWYIEKESNSTPERFAIL